MSHCCNYGTKVYPVLCESTAPGLTFNSPTALLFLYSGLQVRSCQGTMAPLLAEGWATRPASVSWRNSLAFGGGGIALYDIRSGEAGQGFCSGA